MSAPKQYITSEQVMNNQGYHKIEPNNTYQIIDVQSFQNKFNKTSYVLSASNGCKYFAPGNLVPFIKQYPTTKRFLLETGNMKEYQGSNYTFNAPEYRISELK